MHVIPLLKCTYLVLHVRMYICVIVYTGYRTYVHRYLVAILLCVGGGV